MYAYSITIYALKIPIWQVIYNVKEHIVVKHTMVSHSIQKGYLALGLRDIYTILYIQFYKTCHIVGRYYNKTTNITKKYFIYIKLTLLPIQMTIPIASLCTRLLMPSFSLYIFVVSRTLLAEYIYPFLLELLSSSKPGLPKLWRIMRYSPSEHDT